MSAPSPIVGETGRTGREVAVTDLGSGRGAMTNDGMTFANERELLLWLSNTLQQEADSRTILTKAAEAVGRHLAVGSAGFVEIDPAGELAVIECEWLAGSMPSQRGRRRLADFATPDEIDAARRGDVARVDCVAAEPGLDPVRKAAYLALGVQAHVSVPLVKGGELRFIVFAASREPRAWSDEDVVLVRSVAERTWAVLERVRAETALRDAERQHRFLLDLGDRMRRVTDAPEILGIAAEALGSHLGVSRAGYAEIDADSQTFVVERDWTDGTVKPGAGRRSMRSFGDAVVDMLYRGETQRIDDARDDPRVRPQDRAAFEEMAIEAAITVPLVKGGRLVAMMSLHQNRPRVWTHAEVRLIEEVADRTWAALERARAEAALRVTQARQAFLLALGDRVRTMADPAEILAASNEMLGSHLGASRVGYAEIDAGGDHIEVRHNWTDGSVASVEGRHPFLAFGESNVALLRAGGTFRLDDATDEQAVPVSARPAYAAMSIASAVSVPLIKNDRLVAVLSVHQKVPRIWTDADVHLIREVAERTWATLEQARAEIERRQSQALLDAFMRNAPVGMYLKDAAGRYVLANAGMDRVFGRPAVEALGRTADELFDAPVRERIEAQDTVALAKGCAQVAEQHLPGTEDGSWTLVIRFPVDLDSQGRQIGGFAIDITAQKRAEAELVRSREALYQSEKLTALGSLLAGVSHELNNPLAVVVGQSIMLEEDAQGTRMAERAAKVRRAAERCAKITQTFLAMARQKPPSRGRVDANAVVEAALDLTGYGLRSAGIMVVRNLAADLPPLDADPDQLHQVFANLVVNAQQALEEVDGERCISVATRHDRSSNTIEIEVSDTGRGVPETLRRRVFEPFFTTKIQGVGTGLGLSYSLGVVEAHDGRLELLENATGATFRVTLPVGQTSAATAAAVPDAGAPSVGAGHALVVDDEPEIADMIAEILEGQGYRVRLAGSGAEAKREVAARAFDLILSDLRMPDVDGQAFHGWLAAEHPHYLSRTGFITGDTMGPSAARFLERAGRPCLEKPFTPKVLRAFVEQLRAAAAEA